MQSLPLAVSIAVAAVVAPAAVRALRERGLVRENYRGAEVAFPIGVAVIASALMALIPLSLVYELADEPEVFNFRPEVPLVGLGLLPISAFVLGIAALGLLDDLLGSGAIGKREEGTPRGWRGHARTTLGGGLSTGALKAAGTLGLALFILSGRGLDTSDYFLSAAVLVLCTNLFNLLDLRPGRSIKGFILLGAALTLGPMDVEALWALGVFVGPILVLLPFDLREKGMLGDTGSNVIGAVAGLWLVLTFSTQGLLIALAVITVVTIYGEFRSISSLIDRTPGLRHLDSLGRNRLHA